jgi:hypothetical protein
VTIEHRDQVLIGFFALELFILSIFSRRCDSTNGPFFNDLAIKVKLLPCARSLDKLGVTFGTLKARAEASVDCHH